MSDTTALAPREPTAIAPRPDQGLSIDELVARVDKIRTVRDRVMKDGAHYGRIPGIDKPTLLKPGAEILCLTFQLGPTFTTDERSLAGGHREVVATCTLVHQPTGAAVGAGLGSCSTLEAKYAYRTMSRRCPTCGKASIIAGKEQYGGGWICWKKKAGCGAKFSHADPAITSQLSGRVPNPDLADQYNTVLKMATKRALVAAVLMVTGASELFTQDVEDLADAGDAAGDAADHNPSMRSADTPTPAPATGTISRAAQKQVVAAATATGLPLAAIKDWLLARFGATHTREIRAADLEAVLAGLASMKQLPQDRASYLDTQADAAAMSDEDPF
jgi:hypothetical protein